MKINADMLNSQSKFHTSLTYLFRQLRVEIIRIIIKHIMYVLGNLNLTSNPQTNIPSTTFIYQNKFDTFLPTCI